ncbi:MAG: hypothetical protein WDW36_007483 [Sanguina aurantia]
MDGSGGSSEASGSGSARTSVGKKGLMFNVMTPGPTHQGRHFNIGKFTHKPPDFKDPGTKSWRLSQAAPPERILIPARPGKKGEEYAQQQARIAAELAAGRDETANPWVLDRRPASGGPAEVTHRASVEASLDKTVEGAAEYFVLFKVGKHMTAIPVEHWLSYKAVRSEGPISAASAAAKPTFWAERLKPKSVVQEAAAAAAAKASQGKTRKTARDDLDGKGPGRRKGAKAAGGGDEEDEAMEGLYDNVEGLAGTELQPDMPGTAEDWDAEIAREDDSEDVGQDEWDDDPGQRQVLGLEEQEEEGDDEDEAKRNLRAQLQEQRSRGSQAALAPGSTSAHLAHHVRSPANWTGAPRNPVAVTPPRHWFRRLQEAEELALQVQAAAGIDVEEADAEEDGGEGDGGAEEGGEQAGDDEEEAEDFEDLDAFAQLFERSDTGRPSTPTGLPLSWATAQEGLASIMRVRSGKGSLAGAAAAAAAAAHFSANLSPSSGAGPSTSPASGSKRRAEPEVKLEQGTQPAPKRVRPSPSAAAAKTAVKAEPTTTAAAVKTEPVAVCPSEAEISAVLAAYGRPMRLKDLLHTFAARTGNGNYTQFKARVLKDCGAAGADV